MSEQTGTDATTSCPTPVAPHEAKLVEQPSPRLTLTHGLGSKHAEEEFDALADLFLGDESDQEPPTSTLQSKHAPPVRVTLGNARPLPVELQTPPIEGLILGHLPVSASSWVKTYAAMRARALGGPVGLIRLMGGSLAIDLVGVDSKGDLGTSTIEGALSALRQRAVGIVARVDEMGEPDLACGAIDGMVVLSGGDEAAVVGAFRTIKSLASHGEDKLDETPIRVAIVGHDAEGAQDAFARLSRSAMHSLSREIAFAGSVERLASEPSASLFHGEWSGTIGTLLDQVGGQASTTAPTPPEIKPASDEAVRAVEPVIMSEQVAAREPVQTKEPLQRTGRAVPSPVVVEIPAPIAAQDRPMTQEAPVAVEMPVTVSDQNRSLSALIEGMRPTEIRSPDVPEIEMAVDADGRLHAICELAQVGHVESVLGWAIRHERLLSMADPRIEMVDENSLAHVLCKDAAKARPMLDGRYRLHLLIEIEVEGKAVRVTRALN